MNIYFSKTYNETGIGFDTFRKATEVARDLAHRPVRGVTLKNPRPANWDELLLAHDAAYLDAVYTGKPVWLAHSNGLGWDENLWNAAASSTGGAISAATDAYLTRQNTGSLSSGLHHASRMGGAGFCTFNGVALGALAAVDIGAKRVVIFDADAHCGGGTADIIKNHPNIRQEDVSVSPYDNYRRNPNSNLRMVSNPKRYNDVIRRTLENLESPESIDLLIYNAGMDPHEEAGGLDGITADMLAQREDFVFSWAAQHGVPVAWVLAGGYIGQNFPMSDVVALHRFTVEAAARHSSN